MTETLFLSSIGICAVLGIVFWVKTFSAQNNDTLPVKFVPLGLIHVLLACVASMLLPSLAAGALLSFWQTSTMDDLVVSQKCILFASHSAASLFACVSVAVLLAFKFPDFRSVIWPGANGFWQSLVLAAKYFTMVVPFLLLMQWLLALLVPYEQGTLTFLSENFGFQTVSATWFSAVIAAPVCEEFFFRGVMQTWLQRVRVNGSSEDMLAQIAGGPNSSLSQQTEETVPWVWWWPIVATSILFAIVHIGQGLACIPLFFFGLALGYLYRKTGTIIPCIILHFMLNAFSMFWATLNAYVTSIQ